MPIPTQVTCKPVIPPRPVCLTVPSLKIRKSYVSSCIACTSNARSSYPYVSLFYRLGKC